MEASTSIPSSAVRSWRTIFLTLRDEVQNSPTGSTVVQLLNNLIFSQSETLIAAIPNLPVHEVRRRSLLCPKSHSSVVHTHKCIWLFRSPRMRCFFWNWSGPYRIPEGMMILVMRWCSYPTW